MTYLILSDSHGRPDLVQEAIDRTKPDGILFCGDGLRDLTYAELPALAEGCPLWAVRHRPSGGPPPAERSAPP